MEGEKRSVGAWCSAMAGAGLFCCYGLAGRMKRICLDYSLNVPWGACLPEDCLAQLLRNTSGWNDGIRVLAGWPDSEGR